MEQSAGREAAEAGRFYDALRSSGLSSAVLAHGAASIGQECLLTADEIIALARRAGITAGTSVLDIGSGTGGPACYLARELGCHVLGVDVSAVGHAEAEARAHAGGLDDVVRFRLGDACKFSVNLRHFFSAGLRHQPGTVSARVIPDRGGKECYQPWREARSNS